MLALCAGLLLIACVNVMNMQFARATLRAKELAIRSSLGATRTRLIRQMLTESLLLAAFGAAVGVELAVYATGYLQAATHNQANAIPAYIVFNVDTRVLLFVVAATVIAAVASGFVPAWFASRASAVEALKESGRGNTSRSVNLITRGLVVLQILVSCLLLVAALLQVRAIVHQQRVDYGYDTNAVLTGRMGLMEGAYPTPESRKLFFDRLLRELRADPEFASAALTNRFRMSFSGTAKIEIEGRAYKSDDSDRPLANFEQVSEGYFDTLGAKVLEGRDFTLDDNDTRLPVAIVNSAFAQKYFGRESALGRRFRTVGNNGRLFGPWRTIVGVVQTHAHARAVQQSQRGRHRLLRAVFLQRLRPGPGRSRFRSSSPRWWSARAAAPPRVHAVATPAPARGQQGRSQPAALFRRQRAGQHRHLRRARTGSSPPMFSIFGGVAVLLASVGLYGVTSFLGQPAHPGIRHPAGAGRGPQPASLRWSCDRARSSTPSAPGSASA